MNNSEITKEKIINIFEKVMNKKHYKYNAINHTVEWKICYRIRKDFLKELSCLKQEEKKE